MSDFIPTKNKPKAGFAAGGFEVLKLEMTNSAGEKKDIRDLLESFTITEEINSPILTFNGNFRDEQTFFSDFNITGQEIIDVIISKTITDGVAENGESLSPGGSRQLKITPKQFKISLTFYVKEYPNYTRTLDAPTVQTYSVIAVSDFAYLSNLKKISRSITGNVVENIKTIFLSELYKEVEVFGTSLSEFSGIITTQTPLKALDWLRRRAFEINGTPFFLFSTISQQTNKISLASWKYISRSEPIKEFFYNQRLESAPGTLESYHEETHRILSMQSNLKLDRLQMANDGAYANKTYVIDYANKSYTEKEYDLKNKNDLQPDYSNKDRETVAKYAGFKSFEDYKKAGYKWNRKSEINNKQYIDTFTSFKYQINGKNTEGLDFYQIYDASQTYIQTTSAVNDGFLLNSTSGPVKDNVNFAKSFFALMAEQSHTVTIYGDLRLNPGKKIKLNIPKAQRGETTEFSTELDPRMSGDYIILVAAHTFSSGMYTSRLNVVKNSLPKGEL